MRQLSVMVDLDGVVYDFIECFRRWVITSNNPKVSDEIRTLAGKHDPETTWTFYRDSWGMSTDEFLEACSDGVDAGHIFSSGAPEPEALDAMRQIGLDGHRIHIVTNRSFGRRSQANTEAWLHGHGVPFDSVTYTADKSIIRADLAIDDHIDNFHALRAVGVRCYLLDRPWNRDHDVSSWRLHSPTAFAEKVRQAAGA